VACEGRGSVWLVAGQKPDEGGDETTRATIDVAPLRHAARVSDPPTEETLGSVVYGDQFGDQLVFVPEELAHRLAGLHRNLAAAKTWGELKELLSGFDYDDCVRQRKADDINEFGEPREPEPDLPFTIDQLRWMGEGEWPTDPMDYQLEWMPDDVKSLGHLEDEHMTGPHYLWFSPEAEEAAVARLRAHGYRVRRDDALAAASVGIGITQ
jgi:hypothetical protein